MAQFNVPVQFSGRVVVTVDDSVPEDQREFLAEQLALAKVLAVVENPDAPEEEACEEYRQEFDLSDEQAGADWDKAVAVSVSGDWHVVETCLNLE